VEPLPRGDEDPQARGLPEQLDEEIRPGEEGLEAVEDEQELLVPQKPADPGAPLLALGPGPGGRKRKASGEGLLQQRRVGDLLERDAADPRGAGVGRLGGDLEGQAALSDAPGSDEGEQPTRPPLLGLAQELKGLGDLALPADERGERPQRAPRGGPQAVFLAPRESLPEPSGALLGRKAQLLERPLALRVDAPASWRSPWAMRWRIRRR